MTVDDQVLYHMIGYLYYVIIIYNNFYDYCSLQEKKTHWDIIPSFIASFIYEH